MKKFKLVYFLSMLLMVFSAEAQTCPEIIGYYPNWQWYDRGQLVKPSTIQYSKYTILNYAFFKPESNGSISSTDAWADQNLLLGQINWSTNPISYIPNTSIIDLAHNAGVKVLPSIGGWTLSDNFPGIAASGTKRITFAHHCCDLIRTYQFDGIDIDWEYPGYATHSGTPADKQNFTILLQLIRDSLNVLGAQTNKTYLLTFCAGASRQNMLNVEWNNVQNIADIINLMSYDFFGSWDATSNHNSPLHQPAQGDATFNLDSAVSYLLYHYQIPPNKLAAGVAFYGRSAKTSGPPALFAPITGTDNSTFSDDDGSPLYYNVLKKMNLFTAQWDPIAQVPYLIGNGSLNTFVSYDDPQSIGLKANYIKNKNLRGAIIWEITGDYIETAPGSGIIAATPLVDTLKSVLCNTSTTNPTCNSPSTISATAATNALTINWNTTSASSYTIQFKKQNDFTWSTVTSISNNIVLSSLLCNTAYDVQIQAVCPGSSSAFSPVQTFTTQTCSAGCAIPSSMAAISGTSTLALNWTNTNASLYYIRYKKQNEPNWTTSSSTSNTLTLSGLQNNTTYAVEVQAVCGSTVSNYSNTFIFSTLAPVSGTCNYASWNSTTIYLANDTVSYNGVIYRAKYWTQNDIPAQNYGNCCVWDLIAPCAGYDITTCFKPSYDPLIAYTAGQQVYLNGYVYQAQWWTLNQNPGLNNGPGNVWQLLSNQPCHAVVSMHVWLEGYYNSGAMNRTDTVSVQLYENVNGIPTHLATYKNLLSASGSINCYFPPAVLGKTCYVVVRQRNHIETWSANPVLISQNMMYNFKQQASQAFGANQRALTSGEWALFCGDINQDGVVDGLDFNDWESDNNNFSAGYFSADLNGDDIVDGLDFLLWETNSNAFVGLVAP